MTDHSALLNLVKEVDTVRAGTRPILTNLCTDPQPIDPDNWYGGDNGLIVDSTYVGLHLTKNPAYFSSLYQFALPGNSFVVDPIQSYFGTATPTFQVTEDLLVSFRFRSDSESMTIESNCRAYDSAGTYLGFFGMTPVINDTVPPFKTLTSRWRLDFAQLSADYPEVDSVWLGFIHTSPVAGGDPKFGSAMVVTASSVNDSTVAYGDGTLPGWVTNGDGTSTGRAEATTSWLNLTDVPEDSFLPPGGASGEVLTKDSGTDFDTSWQPPSGMDDAGIAVLVGDDTTPSDTRTALEAISLSDFDTPIADLSMASHKITNVTNPVNPQDADTKAARDTAIGAAISGGSGAATDIAVGALVADNSTPSATRAALNTINATFAANPALKSVAYLAPCAEDTNLTPVGFQLAGVGGSSVPSVAATATSTSMHTSVKRVDLLRTVAAVSNLVGMRATRKWLWRGNAAGLGGFRYQTRFGPATGQTIASRLFVGLDDDLSAGSDVQPSTILNMIGVGYDSADADMYVMTNDGSGTATKVATGLGRSSVDRAKVYTLTIECASNASSVTVTLRDEVAGTSFTTSPSSDLPSSTTFLAPKWRAGTGAVSSVIGLAFMGCYIESPL